MIDTLHFLCIKGKPPLLYRYLRPLTDLEFQAVANCGYLPTDLCFVHIPVDEWRKGGKRVTAINERKVLYRGLFPACPLERIEASGLPRFRNLKNKIRAAYALAGY